MIPVTSLRGGAVALFGLGGSGLATARALVAGGATVTAWDDNAESVAKAAAEGIGTGDLRTMDWSSFAAFILSPGVPLTHPKPHWTVDLARSAGVEVIGDVELFSRERRARAPEAPLIAITGTNGKSTTTALIAHILSASGRDTQLGGNIGTAVLTLDPPTTNRFYVVECSSYQIDLSPSLEPTAGILLNLTPDHIDRHGTMENYAAVKERLVAASQTAIIGVDDAWCEAIADRVALAGRPVIRIARHRSLGDGYYAQDGSVMRAEAGLSEVFAELSEIATLRGSHNGQNAAAAIAACLAVGVSKAEIVSGLASFPGLKHRMQPVAMLRDVTFVNDSKATNAEAAAPALSSFERIYWIAGGVPKEGGIASLSSFFPKIAKAYLIGRAADEFATTLGDRVPFERSQTLEKAVADAAADAARDGSPAAVLLSPACASFDQYKNFEMRGDAFVAHVAALPGVTMLI
ncbi:UDP-N-acetylmuramoylalanine--D-glutamate ligase [Rhizobium sp. Leaf384]|uniref:UDP-N-acetylmuramoyl-L-alanine--D-glutamate ligase n=1 Tax=unclassified Rhizobium TaxID=2613769 RepID=UPI000715F57A|nr:MULTISPECIES: UDP-N-acetylmuramoyl-L-alanine--D-glutamate ligase [unclassified Rhizobium]KQS79410.1 UDP-N-acetylmuramoylalanine--D-glutamate ligase [Rhizobium sp. Leaf384]KQS85051.1 UDP-N-acetylmuramoylalanine--D-glutamate ligase [Rhizobium sp. Leaf383]